MNILLEDMDTSLVNLIKSSNILDSIRLKDVLPFSSLIQLVQLDSIPPIMDFTISKTEVRMQNVFANNILNNGTANGQLPSLYNNLTVRSKMDIAKIPIHVSGRIVTSDFTYDNQLSNYSIEFDYQRFLDDQAQKYKDKQRELLANSDSLVSGNTGIERLKSSLGGFELPELSKEELEILQNELKYQVLQKVIQHPKYVQLISRKDSIESATKNKLLAKRKRLDSLHIDKHRSKKDSLITEVKNFRQKGLDLYKNKRSQADSLVRSIKGKRDSIERRFAFLVDSIQTQFRDIQHEVDSLYEVFEEKSGYVKDSLKAQALAIQDEFMNTWEERKTYYQDSLDILKDKLEAQVDDLSSSANVDSLKSQITTDEDQSILQKILANTTKLAIGQSYLDRSWYTVSSLPINGFHYGYSTDGWTGEIAIGRQTFNNTFSPFLSTNLFKRIKGAKVMHANLGHQVNDRLSLSTSYTSYKQDAEVRSGIVLLPVDNDILAIESTYKLSESWLLSAELANSISNRNNSSIENPFGPPKDGSTLAGEATIGARLPSLSYEVGYFFVGPGYENGANPFLLTNRAGLVAKVSSTSIKNIDVSLDLKVGGSIDKSEALNDDQRNFQLLGNLNWNFLPSWSLSAQLSPNTFSQFGSGDVTVTGANTVYNLQVINQGIIFDMSRTTVAGMTNYTADIQYVDTTFNNRQEQFYIQNDLGLSEQSNLSTLVMFGLNRDLSSELNEQINSFYGHVEYSLINKEWNFGFAGQVLSTFVNPDLYTGVKAHLDLKLKSGFLLSFNGMYQVPLENKILNKARLYGSLELGMSF